MKKKILLGLAFGILGILLLHLGGYVWGSAQTIQSPYQYDYAEGYHLYYSQIISDSGTLYGDVSLVPIVTSYPPTYPYVVAGLVDLMPGLASGRFVSFIAGLLSGFTLFLIARRLSKRWWIGLLAGLLYFVPVVVKFWTVVFRVDSLGVLFSLVGLYLLLRLDGNRRLLAGIFFLLAVFTKQVFIAAPTAALVYYLIKDRRFFCKFGGLLVGGGLACLLIGMGLFGRYFIYHLSVYNFGFDFRWSTSFLELLKGPLLAIGIPILLSTSYLVWKRKIIGIPGLYFISTLVLFFALIGKIGSNWNSMLELIAITSILSALCVNELFIKVRSRLEALPKSIPIGSFLIFLVLVIHLAQPLVVLPHVDPILANGYAIASEWTQKTEGSIWSENATLLLGNGKPVLMESSNLTSGKFVERGFVREEAVLDLLDSCDLIILEHSLEAFWSDKSQGYNQARERLTESMVRTIEDNFNLVDDSTGVFWIYGHK